MISPKRTSARNTPRKNYREDDCMETGGRDLRLGRRRVTREDSDSEQFVQKATPKRKRVSKPRAKSMQRVTRITGDLKVRKLNTIGETSVRACGTLPLASSDCR